MLCITRFSITHLKPIKSRKTALIVGLINTFIPFKGRFRFSNLRRNISRQTTCVFNLQIFLDSGLRKQRYNEIIFQLFLRLEIWYAGLWYSSLRLMNLTLKSLLIWPEMERNQLFNMKSQIFFYQLTELNMIFSKTYRVFIAGCWCLTDLIFRWF